MQTDSSRVSITPSPAHTQVLLSIAIKKKNYDKGKKKNPKNFKLRH